MLAEVLKEPERVDAIMVTYTSRFFRNSTKARALKESLRRHGIRVIAIKQETNDDAMGHFIEGIFELVDQLDSDLKGMMTSDAMLEVAKQGYYPSPTPPFGFMKKRVEVKHKVFRNQLIPNPEEVLTHNEVHRVYVGGKGAKATARELNRRGYQYRGRPWSKDKVLKVIEEPAATGTHYWGKTESKTGLWRPKTEWIPISVEPIIDADLFEMAQKVRAERDPQNNPGRSSSSPLLLAQLVECGRCGASFQLQTSGKKSPSGVRYSYYNCRNTIRSGKEVCHGFRVPTKLLEQSLLEHIADSLFTTEHCKQLLHDVVEEGGLLREKTAQHRRLLKQELEDVEKKLRRWQQAFEEGQLPTDLGTERLRELTERQDGRNANGAATGGDGESSPLGDGGGGGFRTVPDGQVGAQGSRGGGGGGGGVGYIHISTTTLGNDALVVNPAHTSTGFSP